MNPYHGQLLNDLIEDINLELTSFCFGYLNKKTSNEVTKLSGAFDKVGVVFFKNITSCCVESATPVLHFAFGLTMDHFGFLKYKLNSKNSFIF